MKKEKDIEEGEIVKRIRYKFLRLPSTYLNEKLNEVNLYRCKEERNEQNLKK